MRHVQSPLPGPLPGLRKHLHMTPVKREMQLRGYFVFCLRTVCAQPASLSLNQGVSWVDRFQHLCEAEKVFPTPEVLQFTGWSFLTMVSWAWQTLYIS